MRNIIFLSNTTWYLYNFRFSLIKELHRNGNYKIFLVAPIDEYASNFKNLGINIIHWDLNRSSLNPLSAIKSILSLLKIYYKVKPDIVHSFTIKSVIYGSIASKIVGVNLIINTFTGLGQVFFLKEKKRFILKHLIMFVYSKILSIRNSKIVVQNISDKKEIEKISKNI